MKTSKIIITSLMFAFLGFTFVSCEKDDDDNTNDEIGYETFTDDDMAEDFSNEVFNDAEAGSGFTFTGKKSDKGKFQTCATITKTTNSSGKIIVIDFGTEGCKGPRNHIKKGKMIITLTGNRRENNFTKKVELEDFFINDHKIEGTRTIVTTLTTAGLKQTVTLEDGKVTFPEDSIVVEHEFTKTREIVEGFETPLVFKDDIWEITGTGKGKNYKQKDYVMNITTPIRHKFICRFPISGVKRYSVDGNTGSIDFGDDECDNSATISVNGTTKEIQLGRRWKKQ